MKSASGSYVLAPEQDGLLQLVLIGHQKMKHLALEMGLVMSYTQEHFPSLSVKIKL